MYNWTEQRLFCPTANDQNFLKCSPGSTCEHKSVYTVKIISLHNRPSTGQKHFESASEHSECENVLWWLFGCSWVRAVSEINSWDSARLAERNLTTQQNARLVFFVRVLCKMMCCGGLSALSNIVCPAVSVTDAGLIQHRFVKTQLLMTWEMRAQTFLTWFLHTLPRLTSSRASPAWCGVSR